jgi:hypothetical protein
MNHAHSGLLVLLVAGLVPAAATAGQQDPPGREPEHEVRATVDVGRLPLDLDRVSRRLRQEAARESWSPLNLQYFVGVFAEAPPIEFFRPDADLVFGPVPRSAPTHSEMLRMMTPPYVSSPGGGGIPLFSWGGGTSRRK